MNKQQSRATKNRRNENNIQSQSDREPLLRFSSAHSASYEIIDRKANAPKIVQCLCQPLMAIHKPENDDADVDDGKKKSTTIKKKKKRKKKLKVKSYRIITHFTFIISFYSIVHTHRYAQCSAIDAILIANTITISLQAHARQLRYVVVNTFIVVSSIKARHKSFFALSTVALCDLTPVREAVREQQR